MTRAVADQLQLGEPAVSYGLLDFRGTVAPSDEVAAGAAGVHARRVGRGYLDRARAFFSELLHCRRKQLLNLAKAQQTIGRLLQRGEVRDDFQLQFLDELRHVLQQRDYAAIILLLMTLEHENR